MKRMVYFITVLLCLASCGSGEPVPAELEKKYQLSSYGSVGLQEFFEEPGVPAICSQNTYTYTDGLLSERVFHQQSESSSVPFEMEERTSITYADRTVMISNDRETLRYVLNDEGLALSAERLGGEQRRTYQFAYSEAGRLTHVTEMVDDQLFARCDIVFTDNVTALMKTTVQDHTQTFRLTFEPENMREGENTLPILFLTEQYPLSHHETAFYANLLGTHNPTLLKEVTPLDNEETAETLSYTYVMGAHGEMTMLTATTISSGNRHVRNVSYTLKK